MCSCLNTAPRWAHTDSEMSWTVIFNNNYYSELVESAYRSRRCIVQPASFFWAVILIEKHAAYDLVGNNIRFYIRNSSLLYQIQTNLITEHNERTMMVGGWKKELRVSQEDRMVVGGCTKERVALVGG